MKKLILILLLLIFLPLSVYAFKPEQEIHYLLAGTSNTIRIANTSNIEYQNISVITITGNSTKEKFSFTTEEGNAIWVKDNNTWNLKVVTKSGKIYQDKRLYCLYPQNISNFSYFPLYITGLFPKLGRAYYWELQE
ncbi:MAG: hypothetical protein GYA14_14150 [Ignavibacteria bacterium]|nr:hypothetical protein [Ignavibacteria bacterium]